MDRRGPPVHSAGPSSLALTTGLALVAAMAVLVAVVATAGGGPPAPTTAPSTASRQTAGCSGTGPERLPAGARAGDPVVGDLDGDHRPDRFLMYESPPPPPSERSSGSGPSGDVSPRMRTELATGVVVDVSSEGWRPTATPVGVVDLDRDGRDEVVVDPKDGATAFSVDLVAFTDCQPRQVTAADGTFPELYYYQNSLCCIGEIIGVECADVDGDSHIDVITTDQKPSGEWSYEAYRLVNRHLVPSSSGHGTGPDGRPSSLRFSGGFDCHGFHYG